MNVDEWDDPEIGITVLEKGVVKWYDKYFHFWQRKNVFDVYLKQEDYTQILVVVLKNGSVGEAYFPPEEEYKPLTAMQTAYDIAIRQITKDGIQKSDYEKYLKPTLGTVRPDPTLVSYIEKI